MYFHLKMYKDTNIANLTATVERAVAVLDRDVAEETGTAAKTLIRFVSLSIVFFFTRMYRSGTVNLDFIHRQGFPSN